MLKQTAGARPKFALFSVSNKNGIEEQATRLEQHGFVIAASGGTAAHLRKHGIQVRSTDELRAQSMRYRLAPLTDQVGLTDRQIESVVGKLAKSKMLGGRITSLSPEVFGGMLGTLSMSEEMEDLGMEWLEIVCYDFYPLEEAIQQGLTLQQVYEKTDVGGPAGLIAAAKGERIPCTRENIDKVLTWLSAGCPDEDDFRRQMAAEAVAAVTGYYAKLLNYLDEEGEYEAVFLKRGMRLGYAENRWQGEADIMTPFNGTNDPLALSKFDLIEGSLPGGCNVLDATGALRGLTLISANFQSNFNDTPYVAVGVKHTNSCGVGVDWTSPARAVRKMIESNPRAVFGGIVAVNFTLYAEEAEILCTHLGRRVIDAVLASRFTPDAVEILKRKNGRCRMLVNPALSQLNSLGLDTTQELKMLRGGEFLRQESFNRDISLQDQELTGQLPDDKILDLIIAFSVCAVNVSNTITAARDGKLLGSGHAQVDRVGAVEEMLAQADQFHGGAEGAVVASDSFFPFPDGPEKLVEAGVAAVFATSGSIRDKRVQEVFEEADVPFIQGPDYLYRLFRH